MSDLAYSPTLVGLPPRPSAAGLGDVHLVGRDESLVELSDRLARGISEVTITSEPVATTLHGLGGIGKTALALEFCHRRVLHNGRYSLVWWINADSEATVAASFRELGRAYGVELDDRALRQHAAQLLAQVGPWLAVYDNVKDKNFYDEWKLDASNGQVLITTRSNVGWSNDFPVSLLSPQDSVEWLLSAAGNPESLDEQLAALALVSRLDGLALALTMATSFIANPKTKVSLRQYLEWFDQGNDRLLNDRWVEISGYDKTVYTALTVARDQLRTDDVEAAVLILEVASFYAPDDIPMRVFDPEQLGLRSSIEVRQAIRALADLSLVEVGETGEHFSVHRLIQDVNLFNLQNPKLAEATPLAESKEDPSLLAVDARSILKMVMVTVNDPADGLDLEGEVRNVKQALRTSLHAARSEPRLVPAAQPEDLPEELRRHRPRVVHFSGHGNTVGLQFRTAAGGRIPVSGEVLAEMFAGQGVELVVLNACYSASQAEAIAAQVPVVVGSSEPMKDGAAVHFSAAFYKAIGDGATTAHALRDGQAVARAYGYTDRFEALGDAATQRLLEPGPAA